MAGILDGLDPQTALLLGLSSGLLGTAGQGRRATFGEALGAGLQSGMGGYRAAVQDRRQLEQMQAQREAQQQQMRLAQEAAAREQQTFDLRMSEAQRQRQEQARLAELAQRFVKSPAQMAMEQGAQAGSVGPTNANADRLAAAPGATGYDFAGYADALAGVDPMRSLQLKQALRKEEPAPVVVAEGGALVDPRSGKPLFTNPKPEKTEPLQYQDVGDFVVGLDRTGREVVRLPKGASPATAPKPQDVPTQVVTAFNENKASLDKLNRAIDLVQTRGGSLGAQNYLGDAVMQRLDPGGVELRAMIADIGSLKIHDRSGAAVSAAEFPRLKPFIPSATDTPETVLKKLGQFKTELEAVQRDLSSAYSAGNNFKPMIGQWPAQNAASPAPAASGGKVADERSIAHTLRNNPGVTRDQLYRQLEAAGYTIQDRMYRPKRSGASGDY